MLAAINRILNARIMNDKRLSASSRALYQAMHAHAKTTAKAYSDAFDIPGATIRRCLVQLQQCNWVYAFPNPSRGHLVYVPWMPLDLEHEMAVFVEQFADSTANRGEFIMKAILDTLVNDPNFRDNVRFQWTRMGTGHSRLEFDRYYPDNRVAIEFQGRQHFEEVTFGHQKSNLEEQQIRDGLKALACLRQQVTLVEIIDIELSYETVAAKLAHHIPLLPVRINQPLIRTIANLAADYAQWARDQRARGTG